MNKKQQSIYHANVNVYSIVENVIQIKNGITMKFGVSVKIRKNIICEKNIILGIFLHVLVKMVNI